jgi:enamine deaminase RidA (YjgF/YER057c/UK114 family)
MSFVFRPVRPAELKIAGTHPLERLHSMGLTLPKAPGAVAAYVPWAITGDLLMTSGQPPWIDGKLLYSGKVGKELTPAQGYEACQLSALNAIAQLADATGDLESIKRIVRLEGTLNVAPGFTGHPSVLNGASDLIFAVFGEAGRHTRMIYTNPEMPLDCFCLIVLIAEINP